MTPYLNAKRTISPVSRVLTTLDFLGYVPVLLLISWMATAVNMTTTITLLARGSNLHVKFCNVEIARNQRCHSES